ncbi:hypothetical protein M5W75_01965 [Paenibacillus larvae]|nr:hypothetical protein [Paenibacillus larvae]MCY9748642.1 hypothetical protein [Paenibacillus larvae]
MGATKEGKKNVSKIAQYAVVDQLSVKGYSISMLCEIAHGGSILKGKDSRRTSTLTWHLRISTDANLVEEDVWYTRKPQKGLSFNETNGDTSSDSQKEKVL